jgi:integrase/recombinase XerD
MSESIEEFLLSLTGRSLATKKLYRIVLSHFEEFSENGKKLKNQTIHRFLRHLEDEHQYKKNTLRAYVNILRSLFRFIGREDLRKQVKPIRPSKTLPLVPTSEEIEKMISCAEKLRDKVIIQTLAHTGLRVGELCNLDIQDIDLPNLRITIRGRGEWGPKGGKERSVRIDPETAALVEEYNGARKEGRLIDIKAATVRTVLRKIAKRAGVRNAENITPHKLRHYFACNFLQKGGDLRSLQKLLGHSTISVTEIYLDYSDAMVSQAYDKVFAASNTVTKEPIHKGSMPNQKES